MTVRASGLGVHANVVAFEGADERLCHAIGLGAADRGGAGYQADITGEGGYRARCSSCGYR